MFETSEVLEAVSVLTERSEQFDSEGHLQRAADLEMIVAMYAKRDVFAQDFWRSAFEAAQRSTEGRADEELVRSLLLVAEYSHSNASNRLARLVLSYKSDLPGPGNSSPDTAA